MNWRNTTIQQYQLISEIGEELERIDREIWVLAILNRKSYEYYESMPISQLEKLSTQTEFISKPINEAINKSVRIGRFRYKFTANRNELLAHQFVAIQKMWQEDSTKNLHRIMAYLSVKCNLLGRPVKIKNAADEFEKRSLLFQERLDMETAMNNLLFFSTFFNKSLPIILPYLAEEVKKAETHGGSGLNSQTNLHKATT